MRAIPKAAVPRRWFSSSPIPTIQTHRKLIRKEIISLDFSFVSLFGKFITSNCVRLSPAAAAAPINNNHGICKLACFEYQYRVVCGANWAEPKHSRHRSFNSIVWSNFRTFTFSENLFFIISGAEIVLFLNGSCDYTQLHNTHQFKLNGPMPASTWGAAGLIN